MGCKSSKTPVAQPEKHQPATGVLFEKPENQEAHDGKAQNTATTSTATGPQTDAAASVQDQKDTPLNAAPSDKPEVQEIKAQDMTAVSGENSPQTDAAVDAQDQKAAPENAAPLQEAKNTDTKAQESAKASTENGPQTDATAAVEDREATPKIAATTADDDLQTHQQTAPDGALASGALIGMSEGVTADTADTVLAAGEGTPAPGQNDKSAAEKVPVKPQSDSWFSCTTCVAVDQESEVAISKAQ